MNQQKLFDTITFGSVLFLIAAAFYLASRSLWGVEMQRFEVVTLTTLTFFAVAWLLSSVLPAAGEFYEVGAKGAAGIVIVLGIFLLVLEVSMTHVGLKWLGQQSVGLQLTMSDMQIHVISFGLSIFNIFAKWTFVNAIGEVREYRRQQTEAALAKQIETQKEADRKARAEARTKREIERELAGLPKRASRKGSKKRR